MIAEVAEFDAAKALFDLELDHARQAGATLPSEIRLGVMVEVPSLLWQLDQLLSRVDFVSIGSNDLAQFLFAHDRGSPRLGKRFDPLSPPMLNVLHELVERTKAAGVSLTLCGEMAGKPIEAMVLLGLGFRCISMTAASIGPVKMMTRSLAIGPLTLLLERLRLSATHSVREELRLYALDHGVVL
jgi:phosphotransferase system enzyme I (PtsP)